MANFTIPYTTSGNYTFDANKITVSGGLATLKDLTTDNARLYNSFDVDKDANWADGSKIGTLNGSPTFSGGKMVCTGTQGVYYIANSLAVESWKVKYTPNYTGSPPANINIISTCGTTNNDRLNVTHSPSGDNFRITLNNSSGTQIYLAVTIGSSGINLQSGTEYEIEVVINSTSGIIRLFLNGTLHGTLTPGAWSRGGISKRYTVGADTNIYNRAEGSFNDYILFDNEQHTSSYTPGYSPSATVYVTDEPTIFKTTGNSLSDIAEWNIFTETLGGSHQGTINYQLSEDGSTWKYWNGSAWVTAIGNQYNGISVVNDNINNFPAGADKIYVRAFLLSDGDQIVELDENIINFTINTAPMINAGINKTAIHNVAINAFSDATLIDDENNITIAEYKLVDDISWTNIPLGSFSTFEEAIQNVSITFTHSGIKELQLRITDSYNEQVIDTLDINVNRVNITINIQDEFNFDLPNILFTPGDSLHTVEIQNSPFILDYEIGTHTYTATKNSFDTESDEVTIDTTSTELTINLNRSTKINEILFNVNFPDKISKSDTILIDFKVLNQNLLGWKIRAEIFDNCGHCIKLATSNIIGGSDSQIDLFNPSTGEFLIKVDEDLTINFDRKAFIEVELENPEGQKLTIWKHDFIFNCEEIKWTENN